MARNNRIEKEKKYRFITEETDPILFNILYNENLSIDMHNSNFNLKIELIEVCYCVQEGSSYAEYKVDKDCGLCDGVGFTITPNGASILKLLECNEELKRQKDIIKYKEKE